MWLGALAVEPALGLSPYPLLVVLAGAALLFSRCNGQLLPVLPFAIVAYTTWPLFHRESPALTLQSLHVSHMLPTVWTLTLLHLLPGRLKGRQDYRCWGGALRLSGGPAGTRAGRHQKRRLRFRNRLSFWYRERDLNSQGVATGGF